MSSNDTPQRRFSSVVTTTSVQQESSDATQVLNSPRSDVPMEETDFMRQFRELKLQMDRNEDDKKKMKADIDELGTKMVQIQTERDQLITELSNQKNCSNVLLLQFLKELQKQYRQQGFSKEVCKKKLTEWFINLPSPARDQSRPPYDRFMDELELESWEEHGLFKRLALFIKQQIVCTSDTL